MKISLEVFTSKFEQEEEIFDKLEDRSRDYLIRGAERRGEGEGGRGGRKRGGEWQEPRKTTECHQLYPHS